MAYGTKYIMPFTNNLNEFYEIYFDVLDYTGQPAVLTAPDDVLTIRCLQGDQNKLEPILGSEALINILVEEDTDLDISDFVAETDNEIRVTVYKDQHYDTFNFQGFIVVEDNSQPFLDPPYLLSVRALDGLGLLKGVDLGDLNDLRYVGRYSVVEWIMQILYKTGQTLNLRTYFNFYNTAFSQTIGALEQVYLDASTFSSGDAFNPDPSDPTIDVIAQSADDCYTALEKIVRCFRCRLFQENGVWNLVSLYEYLNPNGFSYREYAFGAITNGIVAVNPVASDLNRDLSATVGKDQIIIPVQDDAVIYLKLATKWIKLTYTYNQSQNKVCNQDFSEGVRDPSLDAVISSSILDPSITPVVNLQTWGYDAYCWENFNGTPSGDGQNNPYPQTPATKKMYIRAVLDLLGYEKERYLVLETDGGLGHYAVPSTFRADVSDIVQLSVTFRNRIHGSSAAPLAYLLLTGDDGTFWALFDVGDGSAPAGNGPTWKPVDSNFHNTDGETPEIAYFTSGTPDYTQWTTMTANMNVSSSLPAAKLPVSGTLQLLLAAPGVGSADPLEFWFKDLSIKILPYLNGSYEQLAGDYNYSSSNLNIKQTEADDVEISDSPKRYFKGALLVANGDLCTPVWSRAGVTESYRFAQAMEYVMYNHLCRVLQKIEGTFVGLIYVPDGDPGSEIPNGFLNSYLFSDHAIPSKRFMLTLFEKNYSTGQAHNVYIETLSDNNDAGFAIPPTYQFSYIFLQ